MSSSQNKKKKTKTVATEPSFAERLASIKEWTPDVEELAKANMKRAADIAECQEKIRFYQRRLSKLKAEHKEVSIISALKRDAEEAWPSLSKKRKWQKELVLAALESEDLPYALTEEAWEDTVPAPIKDDRDIFMARLERSDFRLSYPPVSSFWLQDEEEESSARKLRVPTSLLKDKQVMLKVVEHYPDIVRLGGLDAEFLADKDFFRAFVSDKTRLFLAASDIMRFSEDVRNDAELMLLTLDGCMAKATFVASELRNDKEFALKVAAQRKKGPAFSNMSLRDFSDRLRGDIDVVLAFCRLDGKDLIHASYPLRRHGKVIEAAAKQNAIALTHALPGKAKKRLVGHKKFLLSLDPDEEAREKIWKIITPDLKNDREIAAAFCTKKMIKETPFRESWVNDLEFWKLALKRSPDLYLERPNWGFETPEALELVTIAVENARECPMLCDILLTIVFGVFSQDDISENEALVKALVRSCVFASSFHFLFGLPTSSWESKPFCLELIEMDPWVYEHFSMGMMEDREIVKAVLSPDMLDSIPHYIHHLYPELIAEMISSADANELEMIEDQICDDLWSNRDIALAWVSNGGSYLIENFPEEFEADPDIWLAVAEHNPHDFDMVDYELSSDKEFMLKVVKKKASLITEAEEELLEDYDLLLAAFSADGDLCQHFESNVSGYMRILVTFAAKVRERLQTHEVFIDFLSALSYEQSQECHLTMLDQGNETSLAFKRLIAAYVGIPKGDELSQLRCASASLTRWGF